MIQTITPSERRRLEAALAANAAMPRHHSVLLKMKMPPSSRKASGLCGEFRCHELRQEGEEEQRDLGIEHVGERALPEHLSQRRLTALRRDVGQWFGRDSSIGCR